MNTVYVWCYSIGPPLESAFSNLIILILLIKQWKYVCYNWEEYSVKYFLVKGKAALCLDMLDMWIHNATS